MGNTNPFILRLSKTWQKTFTTCLLLLLPFLAASQTSNLRSKTIPVLNIPQLIDTLTVIPHTVEIKDAQTGKAISPENYQIKNNRIAFDTLITHHSSLITIKYRVLPFDLTAPYARLDSTVFNKNKKDFLIGIPYDPYAGQERPLLPQKGLDYNGNYTRGLSFGNKPKPCAEQPV